MELNQNIQEVIANFAFDGEMVECVTFGNGHINDTYRLTYDVDGSMRRFILQKMNKNVFKKPVELMENVMGVTGWLRQKIRENGGDPDRETLNIIFTREGKPYCIDSEGEYWRAYLFINGAVSYERVEKDDDFYQTAVAFGNFQRLLTDYPAHMLHETIVNFHNTVDRFENFKRALEADVCKRAASVQSEIDFVLSRESLAHALQDRLEQGELPLRVTHNDTKLNNIMVDEATGKAICVVDLDTVMPGLSVHDFGDAIRFGASTGAEDEQDLSKVQMDLHLFEVYTKGFVEGCGGALTKEELDMLPMGALTITFELGIRFLTDYLEGDHYFKVHREGHNLDRCRTQFKLVSDMEEKMLQMNEIVDKYR